MGAVVDIGTTHLLVILYVLASPLVFHRVKQPFMSHAVSFFWVTAFLYACHHVELHSRRVFHIGRLAGLVLLVLWNQVLMLAYLSDLIPRGRGFDWWDFLNSLHRLPSLVIRKLGG